MQNNKGRGMIPLCIHNTIAVSNSQKEIIAQKSPCFHNSNFPYCKKPIMITSMLTYNGLGRFKFV
ncbi:hypothetical protein KsCSTR_10600 [Candidatus Kuenenia stuttgartiensis]|uniref:Uncharacterized protein n=1 Tax=Kuenenia stuttgartiensis TaxID=174633 RepID=Q1PYP8_KUEST|nr:hypothetical protein KsCSTR_10600 [Candidatus Kuenenia stuttgartiensis]CAJ72201.1 unknown protein [Candidatus Kuenenia stuttgartiensis]